jgi:DNA polymerase-3 subunit delta
MAAAELTMDDLEAALAAGEYSSLYLFHGEEDFFVEEAVDRVVNAALKGQDRSFNLDVLSAGEVDPREIVARASAFPMLADRRVVVVRGAEKFADKEIELMLRYVEHPSPTTCFIVAASKLDMRRKLFLALRKKGMAIEFRALRDDRLPGWIEQRVRRRKGTIAPEAAKLLATYVGSSLRDLENEIEKLFLYMGGRTAITADDVATVVGITREFTVFELQKAIGEKNIRRAAMILERMLDAGEQVPRLISFLTGYFATLWRLHDLRRRGVDDREVAGELKINPYFLKEYLDALRRFTVSDIESGFASLVDADEAAKSTATDPRQLMHTLLVRLIGLDRADSSNAA